MVLRSNTAAMYFANDAQIRVSRYKGKLASVLLFFYIIQWTIVSMFLYINRLRFAKHIVHVLSTTYTIYLQIFRKCSNFKDVSLKWFEQPSPNIAFCFGTLDRKNRYYKLRQNKLQQSRRVLRRQDAIKSLIPKYLNNMLLTTKKNKMLNAKCTKCIRSMGY